jgi:hypothetical protein
LPHFGARTLCPHLPGLIVYVLFAPYVQLKTHHKTMIDNSIFSAILYLLGRLSKGRQQMNNKELAEMLKDSIENGDIDSVWFVIGELEKENK